MTAEKVLILTGASRGIGLAIAHYLLKQKTNLVVTSRSKEPLEKLSSEYPGQVKVLTGDASDFGLGQQACDLAHSTWQRLDGIIINHAVLDPVTRIADSDPEAWRRLYDINVFSAVAMVKACLPALRESQGRVIVTSSGAASGYYATWGAYGSSKAAVNHFVATLAVEEPKITALSIRPGVVDTEMQRSIRDTHSTTMTATDAAKFKDLHKSGGLLKPEQPGHVMARLALDGPKDLSGSFLSWDDEKLAKFQD